jgi:ubiquinone/menaquinone biosynthesis C-methylase UbiE
MSEQGSKVGSYFDAEAPEYVRERERQPSFVAQKRFVLEMLEGVGGRALDIGCGPALMEEALLERGFEVWGVDASAQMIAFAKERIAVHRMAARCHLSVGDAEHLDFAEGFFDVIVSMGVLEYFPSHERVIGEMHRLLRRGGIAVLTVPNRAAAYRVAHAAFEALREAAKRVAGRPPAASTRFATNPCLPWQLDRQLEGAGLRKIEGRFCNFIFFPLHELHSGASNALNRRLTGTLSDSALGPLLGSQYVVKVQKTG